MIFSGDVLLGHGMKGKTQAIDESFHINDDNDINDVSDNDNNDNDNNIKNDNNTTTFTTATTTTTTVWTIMTSAMTTTTSSSTFSGHHFRLHLRVIRTFCQVRHVVLEQKCR